MGTGEFTAGGNPAVPGLASSDQGGSRNTVEPRFSEVAGDRPNLFVKSRVRCIEVLFRIFYYCWGKEYRSLYRGLR